MTSEYQQQAIALESTEDDTLSTEFPGAAILRLIMAGRALDITKREAFYTTKPDAARVTKYQQEVAELHNTIETMRFTKLGEYPNVDPRLFHCLIGLATEVAEMFESLVVSMATGTPVDVANMVEELGDGEWYSALVRDVFGVTQEDVQKKKNLAKLTTRYGLGQKFGG